MTMDPQARRLLDLLASLTPAGATPVVRDPETARAAYAALLAQSAPPAESDPVAIEDATIAGPAGALRVRIYRPQLSGSLPTVLFFHGGGWVIGSVETHDAQARAVCERCPSSRRKRRLPTRARASLPSRSTTALLRRGGRTTTSRGWVATHSASRSPDRAWGQPRGGGGHPPSRHGGPGDRCAATRVPGHRRGAVNAVVSGERNWLSPRRRHDVLVLGELSGCGRSDAGVLGDRRSGPEGLAPGGDRDRRVRPAARRGQRVRGIGCAMPAWPSRCSSTPS